MRVTCVLSDYRLGNRLSSPFDDPNVAVFGDDRRLALEPIEKLTAAPLRVVHWIHLVVRLLLLHQCDARAGRAANVWGRWVVGQDLDLVVCVAVGLDLQLGDVRGRKTILFQIVGTRTENTLSIVVFWVLLMNLIIIIRPHPVTYAEHLRGSLGKRRQIVIRLCNWLL